MFWPMLDEDRTAVPCRRLPRREPSWLLSGWQRLTESLLWSETGYREASEAI